MDPEIEVLAGKSKTRPGGWRGELGVVAYIF